MIKPRIRRHFHAPGSEHRIPLDIWRCAGAGLVGYGKNPSVSYRSWRIQYDAELARRIAAGMP
jgi:hypothetical protein